MNEAYRVPSDDPNVRVYKHPSGMVLHTITNRVEAFKELIARTNRNGGAWWLITDGEVYIAMQISRGLYKGFWPVAKALGQPARVELIFG